MTPPEIWIAYLTLVRKETVRFLRLWKQTFLPSAITQGLYFLIFGTFIGSQIADVHGISYVAYIVPGLVMMAVITNAYANVSSSFFGSKFQRNIEELLVSPAPDWIIVAGYVTGGVLRGLVTGVIVFAVSWLFVAPQMEYPFVVLFFALLTSLVFSLAGIINGVFARSFDDVSIIPTFVLTPLTYLGGIFYSISQLPPFWQTLSYFNPIVYMIDGFRYGFYGIEDFPVVWSAVFLCVLVAVLLAAALVLLGRGTGLKS